MTLLAIETSCDETSIAIVTATQESGRTVFTTRSHVTLSQIELHNAYGGVFPAMAKREHAKNLVPILGQALHEAKLLTGKPTVLDQADADRLEQTLEREPETFAALMEFFKGAGKPDIDAIAVTVGPGLEPTLWVGINFARALAAAWSLPLIPTNHMEGHIYSVFTDNTEDFSVPDIAMPAMALLVSGGHTEIIAIKDWGDYEKLGQKRDDAAGEAFDKVGRMLGLPYPGGLYVNLEATKFDPAVHTWVPEFPRPMLHSDSLDFSFSGLKTAVRYLIESLDDPITDAQRIAICYEFQNAVVEVLATKTKKAMEQFPTQDLILAGGVAANPHLRAELAKICEPFGAKVWTPGKGLTGDNALMIAVAGYFNYLRNPNGANPDELRASGRLSLEDTNY